MAEVRFKRCFISASFGADTAWLRQALDEKGIRWADQTSVVPGSDWLEIFTREISISDFVCAVIPDERVGNILFEMGVAYAKGKPILAFVPSSIRLPAAIASMAYIRSDATDTVSLRMGLNAFLEHASATPLRPIRVSGRRGNVNAPNISDSLAPADLERRTVELFEQAGFIVSAPKSQGDQGVDFAIWVDDLEHSLGNPILVQVKAGKLSQASLDPAAARLRQYVAKTHGRCALLIYWDHANREFSISSIKWPLVLQLSGRALYRFISDGTLSQELVRQRNLAVHGAG